MVSSSAQLFLAGEVNADGKEHADSGRAEAVVPAEDFTEPGMGKNTTVVYTAEPNGKIKVTVDGIDANGKSYRVGRLIFVALDGVNCLLVAASTCFHRFR